MSEYEVPAKNPNHRIFVGWNDKLKTYFMKVVRIEPQGNMHPMFDQVGRTFGEIRDLEDLDDLVKRHSKAFDGLSPETYKKLFDDDVPPELDEFDDEE
jgi:hypothetical protein